MEKIENFIYQKLNYTTYQEKLIELDRNEKLKKLGFCHKILTHTSYHYPVDYITIGNGEKDLFLVGGTHGSETIGIDFLLNFIDKLPNIKEFDPNLFTLHIIPLQNPEGFDISSNTLKNISEEQFQGKAYEYYLRYRTDSIIVAAIRKLNLFFEQIQNNPSLSAEQAKRLLENFILEDPAWVQLKDTRVMPNIQIFNNKILEKQEIHNYQEFKIKLLSACQFTIEHLQSHSNDLHDQFLILFLSILKEHLSNQELWTSIKNLEQVKLYQQMFEKMDFSGLNNLDLANDITKMYQTWSHPKGSQIGHDATGVGINLNANHSLSPGIEAMQKQKTIYGPFVKNNIKNYTPGPLGVPTLDSDYFKVAIENKALEDLIDISYQKGSYLATLLYHGTGGQIFYQPFEELMDENTYQDFFQYNKELAMCYHQATDYQLLNSSGSSGYGDYLRRSYPGVLLIELSKMGGNPIGPYGDKNNIYHVFSDNTTALKNLFMYFSKIDAKKKVK